MKRAKIMLTAIVVLAGVGGALAFKAQKFGRGNIYCKFADQAACKLVNYTTTNGGLPLVTTDNACAAAQITTATYTTTDCNVNNEQPTTTAYSTIQ